MLHRRKSSKLKRRCIKLIIMLIVMSVSLFVLFEFKARDLVAITVDNELEIIAQSSMDDAVTDVLSGFVEDFDDLVMTDSAENEKVTSLRTDSIKINMLKAEISAAITEKIKESRVVTVSVPVGAFTGVVLLSSIGPDLPVNLNMGGSCTTTIESEFTSAGINQTVHHIYLYVEADVSLTSPIIAYETTVKSRYELCQTVIVGGTPDMYADFYK